VSAQGRKRKNRESKMLAGRLRSTEEGWVIARVRKGGKEKGKTGDRKTFSRGRPREKGGVVIAVRFSSSMKGSSVIIRGKRKIYVQKEGPQHSLHLGRK